MAEDKNPWREKYRRALTQQEQLETTLAAQQAIFQRAIMALTAAAEGQDSALDERLQAIRTSAKRNDVAGFDRMLKSLPRVTEEVDGRHQKQWHDIHKVLATIANQILQQSPEAEIKPGIKEFKKQLPKNTAVIPATLKRLLQQLSDLQQQALSDTPKSSGGLLGKIFKNKDETVPIELEAPIQPEAADDDWSEIENSNLSIEGDSIEGEIVDETVEVKALDRQRSLPEALLEDRYKDEKSPQVPDRVSIILLEILDSFKMVATAEQKATKARNRISDGLKWFDLAPTLEDIRDFVLQAYLGADNEYQAYLERVYGELSEMLQVLGVSIETEQQMRQASDNLHQSISHGVDVLSQSLEKHNHDTANVNQLKQAVEGHLQQLQFALTNYSEQSEPPSETESLALQLQLLTNKVKQMEENDTSVRERLAEAKQQALTDSLTGLPNREAYNEKVYEEVERWRRYGQALTLAVVDIDFFKKINDNYGHQTGDKALKIVASTISKRLRTVDFMARFGGEEFVLLLPVTNAEAALGMLNRIREGLAKAPFRYKEEKISITVSIGIAEFVDMDNADLVFARADEALYEAKESGRNCCKIKTG